jgi:hypothetical protein
MGGEVLTMKNGKKISRNKEASDVNVQGGFPEELKETLKRQEQLQRHYNQKWKTHPLKETYQTIINGRQVTMYYQEPVQAKTKGAGMAPTLREEPVNPVVLKGEPEHYFNYKDGKKMLIVEGKSKMHKIQTVQEKKRKLYCPVKVTIKRHRVRCGKRFERKCDLEQHIRDAHGTTWREAYTELMKPKTVTVRKIQCPYTRWAKVREECGAKITLTKEINMGYHRLYGYSETIWKPARAKVDEVTKKKEAIVEHCHLYHEMKREQVDLRKLDMICHEKIYVDHIRPCNKTFNSKEDAAEHFIKVHNVKAVWAKKIAAKYKIKGA